MLLDAGAILYVKTTVPQGQMAFDTHSYLNGRTTNPINRSLSAGGSSGGEVALIAMGGAVLGAAGDLGEHDYGKLRAANDHQCYMQMLNWFRRLHPSSGSKLRPLWYQAVGR